MVQKISLSTYIHDPSSFVNQSFASLIPLTCYIYIFHGTNILQKNRKDYYDGDLFWHTLATICEFNMQNMVYNLKNPFACSRKFHRQFKSYWQVQKTSNNGGFQLVIMFPQYWVKPWKRCWAIIISNSIIVLKYKLLR
jgi:hypothetical protein